ncbi:MAG: hypothetical protein IPI18_16520 [Saprospiraceae bacterium]|nr:hypothetical protein [Saprospiraceae bacterium]
MPDKDQTIPDPTPKSEADLPRREVRAGQVKKDQFAPTDAVQDGGGWV